MRSKTHTAGGAAEAMETTISGSNEGNSNAMSSVGISNRLSLH